MHVHAKLLQSCPTLRDPMDCSSYTNYLFQPSLLTYPGSVNLKAGFWDMWNWQGRPWKKEKRPKLPIPEIKNRESLQTLKSLRDKKKFIRSFVATNWTNQMQHTHFLTDTNYRISLEVIGNMKLYIWIRKFTKRLESCFPKILKAILVDNLINILI